MLTRIAALTLLAIGLGGTAGADSLPGSARAADALATCMAAEHAPRAEAETLLARGLAMAEAAVAADDTDAKAHFAVGCNLGRQLQRHPLSLGVLRDMQRLRHEFDRTLELAPNSVDALTAKGAFLLEAPRFFGGDREEGERLIRRALEIDPDFDYARKTLERLTGRGPS